MFKDFLFLYLYAVKHSLLKHNIASTVFFCTIQLTEISKMDQIEYIRRLNQLLEKEINGELTIEEYSELIFLERGDGGLTENQLTVVANPETTARQNTFQPIFNTLRRHRDAGITITEEMWRSAIEQLRSRR